MLFQKIVTFLPFSFSPRNRRSSRPPPFAKVQNPLKLNRLAIGAKLFHPPPIATKAQSYSTNAYSRGF